MSDADNDDSSSNLLNKADDFLRRRRAQIGGVDTKTAPPDADDDIPLLTEVVSRTNLSSAEKITSPSSDEIAREIDTWLDKNLPQVVMHALDGITDKLIAEIHASAKKDLLPRLKRDTDDDAESR